MKAGELRKLSIEKLEAMLKQIDFTLSSNYMKLAVVKQKIAKKDFKDLKGVQGVKELKRMKARILTILRERMNKHLRKKGLKGGVNRNESL